MKKVRWSAEALWVISIGAMAAIAMIVAGAGGCGSHSNRADDQAGNRPQLATSGSLEHPPEMGEGAASGMTLDAYLVSASGEKLVPPTPDGAITADEAPVNVEGKGI